VDDDDLRLALSAIEPRGRELLRRYLIAYQPDRDALALRLLHAGTEHARWLADLIDTLTMHPGPAAKLPPMNLRAAAFPNEPE
jgi:hypothetical protein